MNNIADNGCRQQGLSIVIPMRTKLSRFLLSSSESMIDTRISRDPDGCPTISKRNMHLHIATIFPDKGTNFNILSIGQNIARNEYKSCHAEHEAINRLKNRNTKQLMGINIYVLRTTLTGSIGMSKPCAHCLAIMCSLPQKKGYKINNIFYTDQNGNIEKKKLGELLNDDLHISRMYTERSFKPTFHKVH